MYLKRRILHRNNPGNHISRFILFNPLHNNINDIDAMIATVILDHNTINHDRRKSGPTSVFGRDRNAPRATIQNKGCKSPKNKLPK